MSKEKKKTIIISHLTSNVAIFPVNACGIYLNRSVLFYPFKLSYNYYTDPIIYSFT